MTAYFYHLAFEFRTGVRNRSLLFLNYMFPLIFFAFMGFLMPSLNPTFLEALVPAMVTFAVLAASLLGLPDPLVSARESGIFRSYKINGVPVSSILLAPALSTLVHLCLVSILIVALSPLLFAAPLPTNWLAFVLTFFGLAFATVGLSVLIGVVAPSTRLTILFTQLIFIPSMLLGGLMLPFDILPAKLQRVALLLPSTHAMNLFRGPAMNQPAAFNPVGSALVLVGVGVLALALAFYLFTWDRNTSGRRGHPALALLVLLPLIASAILL